MKMITRKTAKRWWWVLSAAIFLSITPSAVNAAEPERKEALDTDKDGKPDEWRYYQGKALIRIERDKDHNGRVDIWLYVKDGKTDRAEMDRNGDGKSDMERLMMIDGKTDRERADLNFDGKWDAWSFYKNGIKESMIMDKNYDGRPDAWFYYAPNGIQILGAVMDDNHDGKPDRTIGTVPEGETRQPW